MRTKIRVSSAGSGSEKRKNCTKYKVNKTYGYERYADCLASGDIRCGIYRASNNMHRAYSEGAAKRVCTYYAKPLDD